MSHSDPSVKSLELLFQRVPYGLEVVWVDNSQEVWDLLYPLSKLKGAWVWNGEYKPSAGDEHSRPTFQVGKWRMWSMSKGKLMVATSQPDMEKMRAWVNSQTRH